MHTMEDARDFRILRRPWLCLFLLFGVLQLLRILPPFTAGVSASTISSILSGAVIPVFGIFALIAAIPAVFYQIPVFYQIQLLKLSLEAQAAE